MTERPDAITWSRPASASTPGRLCCYLQVGFFGGLALLVIGFGVAVVVLSAVRGAYGQLALLVLLLFIGGPFSVLYLLPVIADRDVRSSIRERADRTGYGRLSASRAVVSALAGAGAIVGSVAVSPLLLLALFFAVPVGTSVCTGLIASAGTIDPETGTVRVNERSFDLEELVDVRAHRVPVVGTVVLRPSYATKTRGVTAPGYVSMPQGAYEAAKPLFEAAVERETEPANGPSRSERIVLVLFAGGALAGAIGAVFLGLERGGDALVILSYVAFVAGCFAVGFLALAARDS